MDRGKQKQRRRSQDELAVHREGLWRWDLVGLLPCASRALHPNSLQHSSQDTQKDREVQGGSGEKCVPFRCAPVLKVPLSVGVCEREHSRGPRPAAELHPRGGCQLVEQDVGVAAAHLAGGHWRYSGVIEGVPFSRAGVATVGCVVTAHRGA